MSTEYNEIPQSQNDIEFWLDSNIKSNLAKPITGDNINTAFKKMTVSFFNKQDDAGKDGLKTYNESASYLEGDTAIYESKIYQANKSTSGSFVLADWDALTPDVSHYATTDELAAVSSGLKPKVPVRVATTTPLDLTAGGLLTIDGIIVVAGDRVLVKDQTDAVQNGIYIANTSSWQRAEDADDNPNNEIERGSFLFVQEGTANAGYGFFVSNQGTGDLVIDTDPIQFSVMGRIAPDLANYVTLTQLSSQLATIDLEKVLSNGNTVPSCTITSAAETTITSASDVTIASTNGAISLNAQVKTNFDTNAASEDTLTRKDYVDTSIENVKAQIPIVAQAFDELQDAAALAAKGDVGKSASLVMEPTEEGVFITSLADNNVLEINDAYVTTLAKGQNYTYKGEVGDKIVSSKGHTGITGTAGTSVHPLSYAAHGAKQFFAYVFRSPTAYFNVATGAVGATVTVTSPNKTTQVEEIAPFSLVKFPATSVGEYKIEATQPVFITTIAATTVTNIAAANVDQRAILPLATTIIGHVRFSSVSALYPNTEVTAYSRMGNVKTFTVSPGSPVNLYSLMTTESLKTYYDPNGYVILYAKGPISCYSGADGDGSEATPFAPTDTLPFRIGIPLPITGGNAKRYISFASPYEGTIKIYDKTGALVNTGSLTRGGSINSPATSETEQLHPAGYRYIIPSGSVLGEGGYAEADVPIFAVANFYGTGYSGEETMLVGINLETPRTFKKNPTTGLMIGESFDEANNQTWVTV